MKKRTCHQVDFNISKAKTDLLLDMSVPRYKNTSVKEYNRISKYKDLEIEIEKMGLFKTSTVPVLVGVLGIVKKGTVEDINKIPSSPSEILKNCTLRNCSPPY